MARASKFERKKSRKAAHSFVALPHILLESSAVRSLSGRACKVLLYLAAQYKGANNGDLQCAWKLVARECDWKSRASLHLALQELLGAQLIVRTRQGGRNLCSLYALSWFAVDANVKLDPPWDRGTTTPPNGWRPIVPQIATPLMGQLTPQVGQ